MKEMKSKTIAFTGHRNITADTSILAQDLFCKIEEYYFKGYRTFMCGMAQGFDLLAGEAVLQLKAVHTDTSLIAVIPFARQAHRFCETDKMRYGEILNNADSTVAISEQYYTGCFHRRNDYLIEHASVVVAYYNGIPGGGTYYTVNKAQKQGVAVENMYRHGLSIGGGKVPIKVSKLLMQ